MRRPPLALAVLLMLAGCATVHNAGVPADLIVVVESPDGAPVAGASVVVGADREAPTGADGRARFEAMAPGRYPIQVSAEGEPVRTVLASLEDGGPWALMVDAAPPASGHGQDLSGSALAASGFFERQGSGQGTVFDADVLDAERPLRLGPLVDTSVSGHFVETSGGRHRLVRRYLGQRRGFCQMRVYLDGAYSFALTYDLLSQRPRGVVLVEAYANVQHLPATYSRGELPGLTLCGALLIWTEASLAVPS